MDDATTRLRLADREAGIRERLDEVERRLAAVRAARGDWIDEEHDPEGFALTHEWSQAEGARSRCTAELAEVERAATRVDEGTYGGCAVCGRPIPDEQLALRPERAVCVACAERRARG
jgi:RNA polymerase-binding transcription factor DksA